MSQLAAGQPANGSERAHAPAAASADASTGNPWALLLSAGLRLVEALAAAPGFNAADRQSTIPNLWIEIDAQSGRPYLKLSMPEPQVVRQLGDALSRLIASLAK